MLTQCGCLKLIHFSEKLGRLSSTGSEILTFGSHCSAICQPILDCFIPKFKLKHDDLKNIKTDRVNTVIFNLNQIKQLKIFWDIRYNVLCDQKVIDSGPCLKDHEHFRTSLLSLASVCAFTDSQTAFLKGQLQRFYKLISNDRILPSEHGFEVIFEKSLFVFEISAFKVRNKRGIHSRFHSFSENINRKPSSVTSQVIKAS